MSNAVGSGASSFPAMHGADRRNAERHVVVSFMWFRLLAKESDTDLLNQFVSISCDISETGVGCQAPVALPLGESIFLELLIDKTPFTAIGKIVYSKPYGQTLYRTGLHFAAVSPTSRLLFQRYFGCAYKT
jgi:hypothetical protein